MGLVGRRRSRAAGSSSGQQGGGQDTVQGKSGSGGRTTRATFSGAALGVARLGGSPCLPSCPLFPHRRTTSSSGRSARWWAASSPAGARTGSLMKKKKNVAHMLVHTLVSYPCIIRLFHTLAACPCHIPLLLTPVAYQLWAGGGGGRVRSTTARAASSTTRRRAASSRVAARTACGGKGGSEQDRGHHRKWWQSSGCPRLRWCPLSWLLLPLFVCQAKRDGDRSPFSGNSGDSCNIRPASYYKDGCPEKQNALRTLALYPCFTSLHHTIVSYPCRLPLPHTTVANPCYIPAAGGGRAGACQEHNEADFDPTAAGSGINRATTVPPSAAAGGVSQGSPLLLERAMSC